MAFGITEIFIPKLVRKLFDPVLFVPNFRNQDVTTRGVSGVDIDRFVGELVIGVYGLLDNESCAASSRLLYRHLVDRDPSPCLSRLVHCIEYTEYSESIIDISWNLATPLTSVQKLFEEGETPRPSVAR